MKMTVLHLQFISGISGSEKYIRDLSIAQSKLGNEVSVIFICRSSSLDNFATLVEELHVNDITVYIIKVKYWLSFFCLREIQRLVKKTGADILHAHLLHAEIYASLVRKFSDCKVKLVSTKHGFDEEYLARNGLKATAALKRLPYYWLCRWSERSFDQSYTISRAMAEFFFKSGITRSQLPVIYHGLPFDRGAELLQSESNLRIVAVGRLVPYKGFVHLLRAMQIVMKSLPNVELKVVGDGLQRRELERLANNLGIKENVEFLGFQKHPEITLQTATVAAIPSAIEPFGLVFLEAMYLAKPIVAFDVPAGNEIVEDRRTGLLAKPFDVSQYAEHLISLLKDDLMAQQMGSNGRQRLELYFSFQRMLSSVMELYNNVRRQD